MEEVLQIGKYTIYAYATGGYCVYHESNEKRVYHSATMWESVQYVENKIKGV